MKKLRRGVAAKVKEQELINAISQFLFDCDVDKLAELAGDLLGGKCVYKVEEIYLFTPDENYGGGLDK